MKIQISGYSGAGKSTLANLLGKHYNLPVLHIDNVAFYGDFKERTFEEKEKAVRDFMAKNKDGWVIDGSYYKVAPERFSECDISIFLNYNRFTCYRANYKRYKEYKDKGHRDSFPCEERFDYSFQRWILLDGRTYERRKQHLLMLNKCKKTKYVFKNHKELEKFLKINEIEDK